MNARETVLGRVRDALALAPPDAVQVPRDYRRRRSLPPERRRELLVDRLEDYRASVHQCDTAEAPGAIATALRGARRIGIPAGLDRRWLAEFDGEVTVDSAEVPPARLDELDGVVTGSAVSCAETGTIFLDSSADQGRRALTLVPDLHVCVVALSSVVAGVPEAVTRLDPVRPTTLISGPSATSDIKLDRVEGVHGPRTLHVVLLLDA
ncbi:lactate utilization protein C [Saccharopolyspora sp. 6V]|uniref:LutC/YkgG family protein n=1 Tax=Saccharopolyspora sp. 6V TaxID=2877239 RepID=UPI001CD19A22|nr:lactate utilization protein C [Saccharopolyspora sp. 6V]MCA1194189.1 lactate utilization protein C [Saccharopolyspora sp. 6V]